MNKKVVNLDDVHLLLTVIGITFGERSDCWEIVNGLRSQIETMSFEIERDTESEGDGKMTQTILALIAFGSNVIIKSAYLLAAISLLYNGWTKCGVACIIASFVLGEYHLDIKTNSKGDKDDDKDTD